MGRADEGGRRGDGLIIAGMVIDMDETRLHSADQVITALPSRHGRPQARQPPSGLSERHASAQQVAGYWRVNHLFHSMVQALAAIQGGDGARAERALQAHLMARLAVLKTPQRAETQPIQA